MKFWPFKRQTQREKLEAKKLRKKVLRAKRFKAQRDIVYWARFLNYLGHYKRHLAGILVLLFVSAVLGTALPQLTRFVMDTIVPRRNFALLNAVILGGVGIYGLHAVMRYLEHRLVLNLSLGLVAEIRRDLFRHQLNLPLTYFQKMSPGKLMSKITYSIYAIKMLVETFAYVCLRELTVMAVVVVTAVTIDYRLAIIFLGLTPVFALYIRFVHRAMGDVAVTLQTKNDQIMRILDRAYNSIKLLKIFGEGEREVEKLEKVLGEDKDHRIRRTMLYETNAILIYSLTSIIILATLWYGGRQIILGNLTYGEVMAFILCLGMLLRPVSEFIRASAYLEAGRVGIRTVFSVFENTEPIPEPDHPIVPRERKGKIEFRNLHFRYGMNGSGGIVNLSFAVEPGQKVLIVGPSGAGKSTIFNLLLRLYDAERGSVVIDGVNVRRMKLDVLRSYFTIVTQDQLHVEDTILNNVLYGSGKKEGESDLERALEVARKTGMNRFITSLEKKYGQTVATGGMGFSRGELQKLALMRAATKEAPIVLMDEPTASLDVYSEKEVVSQINEQFAGKTMLIISHRPIPMIKADWIIVMKKGWMENQGNHHYLIQHSKYYRHLLGRTHHIAA
ncbi:MAG TPA: ABC transporter ATP-binding protein [bacterium]|nr:ABC transporter ATP-binding protein [bacterium]